MHSTRAIRAQYESDTRTVREQYVHSTKAIRAQYESDTRTVRERYEQLPETYVSIATRTVTDLEIHWTDSEAASEGQQEVLHIFELHVADAGADVKHDRHVETARTGCVNMHNARADYNE